MLALLALAPACRGSGADSPSAGTERGGERPQLADETQRPLRSSWGRASVGPSPALRVAELERDPRTPAIAEGLGGSGSAREAALWTLARIGGDEARDQISAALDAAELEAIGAAALLEVPRSDPDQPPEPASPGPWAILEDGLWTRYALVDPAASERARALLLAIARVGGSRSVARLAVDLAELPGPSHDGAAIERWASAMEALGILCARGHSLDAGTVSAVLAGIEIRAGIDPELPRAALYALSRCSRSSSELLVESREVLVARLDAHVHASSGPAAALAWRSFAALGELPEQIPAGILGASPPPWTTEVEAVRALGSTARGGAWIRERLAAAQIEDFAGPRQHVLLDSLRALRADIAAAPDEVDAQLATTAAWLVEGRRSEDSRRRKLAALAICELRLLQAIRSGETTELVGCERLAGAPAVELPPSLLVNLEVEALLRATRPEAPGDAKLSVAKIDDEAVLADRGEGPGPIDPGRRARIARLLELADDPEPARAGPAIHALAEIDDPGVGPVLRRALVSADPGTLAAAATAVAVRSVDAGKRDIGLVEPLEAIVRSRTAAAEIEARLAAIEGLGALGRTAIADIDPDPQADAETPDASASPWLERTILPLAGDPGGAVRRRAREALLGHPELLARFDAAARQAALAGRGRPFALPPALREQIEDPDFRPPAGLRVQTSAGSFTIEFAGVPAPINQANLAALAGQGFYDGLSFHRVVPGFVVQGGDPRGDGYGGPGYLVPCEWSNLSYARGTVGIALAGKDTGGSQFFVTQTPQLHLDGRYTVVGQVGEGLEVIDALLPGDRIEAVEVLEGP